MCAPDTAKPKSTRENSHRNPPVEESGRTASHEMTTAKSSELDAAVSTAASPVPQEKDLNKNQKQSLLPPSPPPPPSPSRKIMAHYIRRSHSFLESSSHITAGTLLSLFFVVFASYLPFFLAPNAAKKTYHLAYFDYNVDLTEFCNSIWTWGTDYLLAAAMGFWMKSFPRPTSYSQAVHIFRSQGMLFCYLLSVLAGGLAHQFYITTESRQHWSFRFLWTICVGTVTAAPAFMGSVGTELNHLDRESGSRFAMKIPSIPVWFWAAYAICSTIVVVYGGISYQRPACDIFIAGITQSPSTFYVMVILGLGMKRYALTKNLRITAAVGFILNAPLLPMYPLLVQYTNWPLGMVNAFLHAWLLVAWSTQALCLRQVTVALAEYEKMAAEDTTVKPASAAPGVAVLVGVDEKKED